MRFSSKLSISTQLFINALLTALTVFAILYLSYAKITEVMVEKNQKYTAEISSNIRNNIALYFGEINSILHNISFDPNTQEYLTEKNSARIYEIGKKIKITATNMIDIKKNINEIVVIGENDKYFTLNGQYDIVKNKMTQFPSDNQIHNTGFVNLDGTNHVKNISFIYGMYIPSAYGEASFNKKIGFSALIVDLKPILDELSSFSKNTEIKFFLVDKNGVIVSNNQSTEDINENVIKGLVRDNKGSDQQTVVSINGSNNLLRIQDIPEIEGKIVSLVPEKELLAEMFQIRKLVMAVFITALLILSVFFYFFINNITNPVKKLISFMNVIKKSDILTKKNKIQLEGYAEVTVLANEFNSMFDEIHTLTHQLVNTNSMLYQAEIEKEKAELAFLRSQINPHFLYNTLEAMKGMALEEEMPRIFEMTKSLGLIFRYSVNGSNTVLLSEELKIVKAYVRIHELRFGDRLEALYDISDASLQVPILKMILQPIIENAIFHGLEPKRGNGKLKIISRINGNNLQICVVDNGVGIDKEKLSQLKTSLLSSAGNKMLDSSNAGQGRIGLHNINHRIKLTYGNQYRLSINSEVGSGTEMIINIPIKEDDCV